MDLKQLVYISRPSEPVTSGLLEAIGASAGMRNPAFEVTGLLLFGSGYFMQLLEGPPDCVDALVRTIRRDARHSGVEVLLDRPVTERLYPDWSMGVYNIDMDSGNVDLSAVREKIAAMTGSVDDIRRNLVLAFETLRIPGVRDVGDAA